MELRQPKPHKNPNWIPIIIYKNGIEVAEFRNLQQAFRYFRPLVSTSNTHIYDFLTVGVFEFEPYSLNSDLYEFRTYDERRKRHFVELKLNKETGRKGR
ncbi:hypothetical protein [Peribacillus frigoritolerans]|uniref:hypothetical protein n=1 Tax=Peribacillus frigoritolerans TaxID=450367 RepID=UPI002E23D3CC|nr:hypothetical protein [Peribacillus frigoritolerans]